VASARPNRRRTILILLVLASITLITLDTRGGDNGIGGRVRNGARDLFAPIQDGVDSVTQPIEDWWDGVTRSGDIKAENRRLRRELQTARGDAATARASIRQIAALKRLANLPFVGDLNGVDAQIVLGSPGNFEATVVLNKGTGDGIVVDQPVVSGRGLLGRIARASVKRSTVLLLTDRDSGLGVRDAQTGALGIINGRPDAEVQTLDADPQSAVPFRRGDELVTAGTVGGPYPPDVPVGRVTSVRQRPGDLVPRVTVALYADAGATEFVRVLEWPIP
jgi:rod shape-determining protein MreC